MFFHDRAPSDCFQYFTGASGTVSSLNYAVAMLGTGAYTVCIRRENSHCGISWRQVDTTSPDPFDLDDTLTDGSGKATEDSDAYVSIPGASCEAYGGNQLVDDCTSTADNQDEEGGTVRSESFS